ncbi:MAG: hypothetical protein L0H23_09550 [Luteimonas sp.]|nr:hypothetical protein [Luteimonas sp.]
MESTMELDELKAAWQSLDRQLQQQKRINLELLTETRMRGAKAGLRWLQALAVGQAVIGLVVTVFCARFWTSHMDAPALLLSGIVMHAYGVAMIITGVVEMLLLVRIDYAAQVVTLQKYMALLRQWRIRTRRWLGLAQWLLWIPTTLVMLEYLIGFDLWAHSPATVGWFLAVGIAGLLATLWLMYWSPRALRRRVGNYLDDNSAGALLKRAQASLDEIVSFERE